MEITVSFRLIGMIYTTSKQIIESISGGGAHSFEKVVYIEYPRKRVWTLGFVTSESTNQKNEEFNVEMFNFGGFIYSLNVHMVIRSYRKSITKQSFISFFCGALPQLFLKVEVSAPQFIKTVRIKF